MNKRFLVTLAGLLLLFITVPKTSLAICPSPAMVAGDSYVPTSIQDAYDYACTTYGQTDLTLLLAGETLSEDLFIDQGAVILDGGYDCTFTSKTTTPTAIYGTVTVSDGAVNFAGDIAIVSTDQCDFDRDNDAFTSIGSCAGSADDCNDYDPTIYPGAEELCDSKDNNCDGQIDEGFTPVDADGDGYYGLDACGAAAADCNDADTSIHPGALDNPYDGIDQDCNGADLTFDGETCFYCHLDPTSWADLHDLTTSPDASCTGCHAPLVSNILPGHYGRTVLTDGNGMPAGSIIVCRSCHDPNDSVHKWGDQIVWPKILAVTPNITCDTCHEDRAAAHDTATVHDSRIIDPLCAVCHTSDTTNLGSPGTGTLSSDEDVDSLHRSDCALCHNYTGGVLDAATVQQAVAQGASGIPVTCNDCHNKGDDHTNHDHSATITGSADCIGCHVHSDPQVVVLTHNNSCVTCHGSARAEVIAAIASGQAECIDCHTPHDGPAAHNNLQAPESCAVCHTDKITGTDFNYIMANHAHPILGFTELEKCQRCHNSTLSEVIETIDVGKGSAGITVYCTNCHIAQHVPIVDPSEIHDSILTSTGSTCSLCHIENDWTHTDMIPTASCAICHTSANQDEFNAQHQNDCLICHLSPRTEVIGLIYAGIAGTQVECSNCHTATWETTHAGVAVDHSGIVTTDNTICASCHEDTLLGPTATTHSACSNCHAADTGALISFAEGKIAPGDCTTCHGSDFQAAHQNCSACHETPPSGATPPNSEGAHFEHGAMGFGSTNPSCIACHNSSNHNDGTIDVIFSPDFYALSGPASSSGGTCTNTSCHGGQTTPVWSTDTIDVNTECTSCHAEGTTQYNSYNSGKHWKHTEVACYNCHSVSTLASGHFINLETTTFEQNPATTVGGSDTQLESYDGSRCSNIACHNDKGW